MLITHYTDDEDLRIRKEHFKKLSENCIFDLLSERFFIAIKQISENEWEVLELTKEKIPLLIKGIPCEFTTLHFDEMNGLNVRT